MDFRSGKELINICKQNNISISEVMIQREKSLFNISESDSINRMKIAYKIMKEAALTSVKSEIKSIGGLIGGEAKKINEKRAKSTPVCGTIISKAISYAMGTLEINASMGLIVAAPTAGSCGVIPGCFLAIQEEFNFTDDEMIMALFNASAVGYLIMRNGTVSGAEGGCQAEVGSASAMAASAITYLMGGSAEQSLDSASSALSNLLGLVCDPVAGLVEVPCQKRNSIGVSNALVCSEIILSGVSELVPFDEMVEAMFKVGVKIPEELRETAKGGVATTPSACKYCVK